MIEIITLIILLAALLSFGIYMNEHNKSKLKNHYENGNIDLRAYREVFPNV